MDKVVFWRLDRLQTMYARWHHEQLAESFHSIDALSVWLKAQGDESSSAEIGRLRAAGAVLAQPNAKMRDVRALCAAWGVQCQVRRKNRPTSTLITELQQTVLAKGSSLRARDGATQLGKIYSTLRANALATQLEGSASSETWEEASVAQLGSIASSAEETARIKAVRSRIVRTVGCASGKRRRDATTSCATSVGE